MMLKHALFLLFLYGIKNGSGSPQEQAAESKDILKNGIKKNEVGANGLEANWEKVARNFQNPVLEYLLPKSSGRRSGNPSQGGLMREIRHSQTLLFPNVFVNPLPGHLPNPLPHLESKTKSAEAGTSNPDDLPFDNFWNYLNNKTQLGVSKIQESVVSSPVLHLSKNSEAIREKSTRIQMYPAVAVVLNSFYKDGSLKSSVTHFQADFNSIQATRPETNGKEVSHMAGRKNSNKSPKNPAEGQSSINGYVQPAQNPFLGGRGNAQDSGRVFFWPFADYSPAVIKDPYLRVYNAYITCMYNAVSSMVEYDPEAEICLKEKVESENRDVMKRQRSSNSEKAHAYYGREPSISNVSDEVTMRSDSFDRNGRKRLKTGSEDGSFRRKRRDATSIYLKSTEGDTVDIKLEEPTGSNGVALNAPDERARSFDPVLVNTPPLSTILRPPQQGYADKKKKTKLPKPIKEEGSSEEVGEEHEEENTSQENTNEAVAISPPPEGASVAEAKPIGLAIAGPGGVAASKPQGTAVAGPGGLAIARPVGTAIAGVEVEGSVPIGGQQKNKKKPKQEKEQTDAELHYVGGLTGPIGNPQPKEFADTIYYKTVRESEGNNIQENLLLRGRPNTNGFQLKLGQQNGKYGFLPVFANPEPGDAISQKRVDFPTFFHGLLGNNGQGFDQFQNYRARF